MKDVELRGLILNRLYEKRGDASYQPSSKDYAPPLEEYVFVRIIEQLHQYKLVEANFVNLMGQHHKMVIAARISARGADVVETGKSPDLNIDLMTHNTVNISGSSNVVVGNHNTQTVQHSIGELVKMIDSSAATPAEKAEARSLLRRFVEHPLVSAVAGGAVGLLGG